MVFVLPEDVLQSFIGQCFIFIIFQKNNTKSEYSISYTCIHNSKLFNVGFNTGLIFRFR